MEPFIYRECRATITARIPDTPDADAHPDRVLVQGRGTAHPQFQGGSVVFTEIGEYAIPQPIPVVIVDGELLVEVLAGDESVETQPLFLPVTVDERANQHWSWRLTFDFLTLGEYGDEVAHPPLSFPVEAGDGPLEISTVATPTIRHDGFITRGIRGAGITSITADSGVVTVEWEGGDDVTIPIPTAALATPASDGLMPKADKAKLDGMSGGAFALTLAPGSTVPIVWAGASSASNVLVNQEQGFPWLVTRGLQSISPSGYGTETRPQYDRDANFTRHTQAGVHGYNVAVNGFQSDNYLSHLVTDAIGSLRPAIVFHYVGTQDYKAQRPVSDFETRVRGWVTTLNGKLETPAQHVFVSQYERLDPPIVPIIAGWGEYRDALRRIADDHGTFIDAHPIFQRLRYDQDDPHGLMANTSSLSPAGHRVMADTILDALLGGKRTR